MLRILDDVEAGTDSTTETSYMYYVNDGVYGSFNCILFDHMPVKASLVEVKWTFFKLFRYCRTLLVILIKKLILLC